MSNYQWKYKTKSVFAGVITNILIASTSIYLIFSTGASGTIDTAILVFLLLLFMGGFTIKTAVASEVIARSSITTATQVATYYAAILLFGNSDTQISWLQISFLVLISSGCGILFFNGILSKFDDHTKFSFPLVKPRVDLFNSLQKQKKRHNSLFISLAITFVYSLLVKIFKKIPSNIPLPVLGSISNSPFLVAIGYLIGYENYLVMIAGFIYSLAVFLYFHSTSFADHLMNPLIYSVVIAFILTQGLFTICSSIRKINVEKVLNQVRYFLNFAPKRKITLSSSIYAIALFYIFNGVFFSKSLYPDLAIPFWVFFIIIPVTLFSGLSTLQGIAETGFWFSALEDILPIIIILLTANNNTTAVIMVVISLMVFETAGIYYIINTKFSRSFHFTQRDNLVLNFISAGCATFVVIFFVNLLQNNIGLGTDILPVPYAKTLGMTVKGMVDSLSTGMLPSYLNLKIVIVASIICVLLNKVKISPMVVIGGIMLPFSVFITIGIGAIVNFLLRAKRSEQRAVFSGMATADGLVSTLAVLLSFNFSGTYREKK